MPTTAASPIVDLDATALSAAIHAGHVSCREVMQAGLDRIGQVNPRFNAIVSLQDPRQLLRQADERDAQLARGESMGWLHGIPQAIKDLANGSLRNPAAWNNVFGLRPSQGRVPSWPVQDVWVSQMGTEGPMARSVRDLARLLEIQAGHDPRLPLSLGEPAHFPLEAQRLDAAQVRIGWLADLGGYLPMEPGILDVCAQALHRLEGLGCAVAPLAFGTSPAAVWDAWLVWRRALVATRIAPFLANPANRSQVKPEALWEYDQSRSLTGPAFLAASVQRTVFYQHMVSLLEQHDALALPAAQTWPFDANERWPKEIAGRPMDTYHRWMEVVIYATFAGLPCISVPAGFDERGLPMGLQLIGKPRGELALLRLAAAYEEAAADVISRRP